jgi:branched-chain amino acid transport system permease protein
VLAAIGMSVNGRLAAVYTLGAALAGAAGALLAQTTGFASLDVLDFHRSADVMLALIIGGAGWLWGGLVGAIAFKLMHDLICRPGRRSTGPSGSACSWWC